MRSEMAIPGWIFLLIRCPFSFQKPFSSGTFSSARTTARINRAAGKIRSLMLRLLLSASSHSRVGVMLIEVER